MTTTTNKTTARHSWQILTEYAKSVLDALDQKDMLAGEAIITARSRKTGKHYTYRVRRNEDRGLIWFVDALTGPDNTRNYTRLGFIGIDGIYRHGKWSPLDFNDARNKVFAWLWERVRAGRDSKSLDLMHNGRCARCGRTLTTPESLETGLGPVCSARMAA